MSDHALLWSYSSRDLWADPAQAHIWQIDLDPAAECFADMEQSLSPEEAVRKDRFFAARDRRRFAVRRGAVRAILAGYLNTSPEALRFSSSPHGKPELIVEPRLQFNLTHCEDLALLAVSAGGPVGIDLERLRTDFAPEPLAARFFAPAELEALEQTPPEDKHRVYWGIWTAKEAYLKALGAGLDTPLNSFTVMLDTGQVWLPGPALAPVRLLPLAPSPGFVAAVAVFNFQNSP